MTKIDVLSAGVFVIIIAVCLLLPMMIEPVKMTDVPSLIIAFVGVWIMILAGIKAKTPSKYGRGSFSTFGWGALLTAAGGAWFLRFELIYSLALVLTIVGILAVIAALRM
ncbi:MAG: hypothetical protein U9O89_01800 [Thermoproteota archaeon]|nr:hypothetical protein [Thermoproteota archaeon]